MPSLLILLCGLTVFSLCKLSGIKLASYSLLLFFVQLFYSQKTFFTQIISSLILSTIHNTNLVFASVFTKFYTLYTNPVTKTTKLNYIYI